MSFEVKACAIHEVHKHPVFRERTLAKVKVLLREKRGGDSFDHNLTLRVWADTTGTMSKHDVDMALLTKAAAILKRTMAVADLPETALTPS